MGLVFAVACCGTADGDHTFDITHTHEALQGKLDTPALFHSDEPEDELVARIFEAPDGFRGTFDEVHAHEAKHGLGECLRADGITPLL